MHPESHSTDGAPPPTGSYSQAVAAGPFVFLAGQAPHRADGSLVEGDIAQQLRQVFANLEAVAAAAGLSLRHAVRLGAYISERTDSAAYNRAYAELVNWVPAPARTTIRSNFGTFDVEVDAILLRRD